MKYAKRLFGLKRCGRCSLPLGSNEMVMRARDEVFHLSCFTCAACNQVRPATLVAASSTQESPVDDLFWGIGFSVETAVGQRRHLRNARRRRLLPTPLRDASTAAAAATATTATTTATTATTITTTTAAATASRAGVRSLVFGSAPERLRFGRNDEPRPRAEPDGGPPRHPSAPSAASAPSAPPAAPSARLRLPFPC